LSSGHNQEEINLLELQYNYAVAEEVHLREYMASMDDVCRGQRASVVFTVDGLPEQILTNDDSRRGHGAWSPPIGEALFRIRTSGLSIKIEYAELSEPYWKQHHRISQIDISNVSDSNLSQHATLEPEHEARRLR
jgi:hypothetical protein